jgi:hypothetical protein
MKHAVTVALISLFLACAASAQTNIPAGTLIPASLNGSLNVKRIHPGKQFTAEIMQDIPGTPIERRSNVIGHIASVKPDPSGKPRLQIVFDAVELRDKERIPIKASLRALASFNDVQAAQVPLGGTTTGITPENATTTQIGGEMVYRARGTVAAGDTVVGRPTPWGVLALPRAQPGTPCGGEAFGNTSEQAFWIFSTNACGVFGYGNTQITSTGEQQPVGTVVLTNDKGNIDLQSGTAFLLRVLE